jgi:hypothetical protein
LTLRARRGLNIARAYARQLGRTVDSADEQRAALTRLFELGASEAATVRAHLAAQHDDNNGHDARVPEAAKTGAAAATAVIGD